MKKVLFLLTLIVFQLSFSQDSLSITLDDIQVIGIKPIKREPITLTKIGVDSIRMTFNGNDPFFVINRLSPGIYSQSDAGIPLGYSYIRMRGLDQTRINFTLNGIPLNEMEDQGIYFSNIPDFMSNIGEIQVQRGIGTSKYGTTSFAGSVNLETKSLLKEEGSVEVGMGSFNTFKVSGGYTSGLKGKFAYSSRMSYLRSDGFRENSGTEGFTYFGQGAYYGDKNILKIYGFSGVSKNQMSWFAPTDSMIKQNYRVNINQPDEVDRFNQNLVSINWINYSKQKLKFNSSLYFNNVNGWYSVYFDENFMGRFALNSYQSGAMSNIVYENDGLVLNTGLNYNYYQRSHTMSDNSNTQDLFYKNIGYKQDVIAFLKMVSRDFNGFSLFGDLQYRYVTFNYDGQLFYDWTFFNPKFGGKYIGENFTIHTMFGKTSREVTRSDILYGYDDVIVVDNSTIIDPISGNKYTVNSNPEDCYNFEFGSTFSSNRFNLSTNIYYMYFENERILSGEINYIGLPIRQRVNSSFRTGLELEMDYSIKGFFIGTNLSTSRNRIKRWVDPYTDQRYFDVTSAFSPNFIMNNFINYKIKWLTFGINGQFMSEMYLDNTQNVDFKTPSYYLFGCMLGFEDKNFSVSLNVNNLLNTKHYLPGGVENYDNMFGVSHGLRPTFFVGALRNAFINMKYKF